MTAKIGRASGLLTTMLLCSTSLAMAATYTVNKYTDDGAPGTLRWAITQNNAHPGGNAIILVPAGKAPYVIKTKSLLPALVGPVTLKGFLTARNGEMAPGIAIDGSAFINGDDEKSCPGFGGKGDGPNVRSIEGAGLAIIDTGGVQITGVEIRSFCIGIMILRSHDNHIDHDWVHNTAGAAGILITGDDGTAGGGSTVGLTANNLIEYNKIYETGDGGECTRGSADITYRFNTLVVVQLYHYQHFL